MFNKRFQKLKNIAPLIIKRDPCFPASWLFLWGVWLLSHLLKLHTGFHQTGHLPRSVRLHSQAQPSLLLHPVPGKASREPKSMCSRRTRPQLALLHDPEFSGKGPTLCSIISYWADQLRDLESWMRGSRTRKREDFSVMNKTDLFVSLLTIDYVAFVDKARRWYSGHSKEQARGLCSLQSVLSQICNLCLHKHAYYGEAHDIFFLVHFHV